MLIRDLPIVMVRCLLITVFVEVIIAFILKYRKKDLLNVMLVNILTNPLLNSTAVYINFYYGLKAREIFVVIFEIIVVIIEGMIYHKYMNRRKINGYLLSLILNVSSYIIGLIINKIIY